MQSQASLALIGAEDQPNLEGTRQIGSTEEITKTVEKSDGKSAAAASVGSANNAENKL